jgi:hypothetical protein
MRLKISAPALRHNDMSFFIFSIVTQSGIWCGYSSEVIPAAEPERMRARQLSIRIRTEAHDGQDDGNLPSLIARTGRCFFETCSAAPSMG